MRSNPGEKQETQEAPNYLRLRSKEGSIVIEFILKRSSVEEEPRVVAAISIEAANDRNEPQFQQSRRTNDIRYGDY